MATRRDFLIFTAALSAGCAGRETVTSAPIGVDAKVRPPAVGQSWRYAKHDLFSGTLVDTELDRVSAVGPRVEIETYSNTTNGPPIAYPPWGETWWRKYMDHDRGSAPLPSEVQEPWGMILVDSHWAQLQAYEQPIPLWPAQLRPGWSTRVFTHYKIPDSHQILDWQLTMHAHRWESITVPAGHFTAFRYSSIIDFRFTNASERVAAQRQETIWLAPEVGRWLARESFGTFYQDVGERFHESSYRWELLGWT